jgi:hypothetical protein
MTRTSSNTALDRLAWIDRSFSSRCCVSDASELGRRDGRGRDLRIHDGSRCRRRRRRRRVSPSKHAGHSRVAAQRYASARRTLGLICGRERESEFTTTKAAVAARVGKAITHLCCSLVGVLTCAEEYSPRPWVQCTPPWWTPLGPAPVESGSSSEAPNERRERERFVHLRQSDEIGSVVDIRCVVARALWTCQHDV